MTDFPEHAAFHGMALNGAYPLSERLQFALRALGLYETELTKLELHLQQMSGDNGDLRDQLTRLLNENRDMNKFIDDRLTIDLID